MQRYHLLQIRKLFAQTVYNILLNDEINLCPQVHKTSPEKRAF